MEGESSVTPSIIDELHYSDIQRDKMEAGGEVSPRITDELHSLDIQ